jgi:hypothetical protein
MSSKQSYKNKCASPECKSCHFFSFNASKARKLRLLTYGPIAEPRRGCVKWLLFGRRQLDVADHDGVVLEHVVVAGWALGSIQWICFCCNLQTSLQQGHTKVSVVGFHCLKVCLHKRMSDAIVASDTSQKIGLILSFVASDTENCIQHWKSLFV